MNKKLITLLIGSFFLLPVVSLAANPILEKIKEANGAEVIFKESELNSFFNQELKSFRNGTFAKDLSVGIQEGESSVSVQLLKPFKGKFSVVGSASIKDGKLVPEIKSVHYGWFRMPVWFAEMIGNYALGKNNFGEWFEVPGLSWQKFELRAGEVMVQFKKNAS